MLLRQFFFPCLLKKMNVTLLATLIITQVALWVGYKTDGRQNLVHVLGKRSTFDVDHRSALPPSPTP